MAANPDRGAARERPSLLEWRNWSLWIKLLAVSLVPMVFAVVLGVLQINRQVEDANTYQRMSEQIEARDKVQPLLGGVQEERARAVELLSGANRDPAALTRTAAAVDAAVGQAPQVLGAVRSAGPVAEQQYDQVRGKLAALPQLRQQITSSSVDVIGTVRAYNDIVNSLLSLESTVIDGVRDPEVSGAAEALHQASQADEEMRVQQALVLAGLAENGFTGSVMDALNDSRARLTAELTRLRASSSLDQQRAYDAAMSGPEFAQREGELDAIKQAGTKGSVGLSVESWNRTSSAATDSLAQIRDQLSKEVATRTFALSEDASNSAGRDSAVLLAALVIAAGVTIAITRQLLGSLRQLRRSALSAAEEELPTAVANVRAGDEVEHFVSSVPVETTEEVGQVARAFDQVNLQALRLAAEQASLRHGYSDSFVSVSRRSQSLLERQLRLFEQLEQDEEDPDQLSTLFKLDHLATRMRRNNENLMVLSGSDLARRFTKPTGLGDVLRAAVSEIEHYPRVVVQPVPDVRLVGHVASDLVRLMAELLDNAANYSAPETSVAVSSRQGDDESITIDVLDEGIGMDDEELVEANQRLRRFDDRDLATSRRMGLFVVARLGVRHGVSVQLHGGTGYDGVRASVLVPREHVVSASGPPPEAFTTAAPPSPAPPPAPAPHSGQRNGVSQHGLSTSATGFAPQTGGTDFEPEVHFERGSALPKRGAEPAQADGPPAPTNGHPVPTNGHAVRGDDYPTESLFTPLNLPEPDEQSDDAFAWPEESDSVAPPEPQAPPERAVPESSPQWFEAVNPAPVDPARVDPGLVDAPDSAGSEPAPADHLWPGAEQDAPSWPQSTPDPQSSAASAEPAGETKRSAEQVSQHLADMQGGLRFGRRDRKPAQESAAPDLASAPEPSLSDSGEQAWSFASDDAWRRAEAAVSQDPGTYTSSGLPRRTPKAQLAPGSAGSEPEPARRPRDPNELRGRLSDFQSGVRRGRHRAPDEE